MPTPATPVANPLQWGPREFSRLRNARDKGSPMTQWKNEQSYAQQINALSEFCKTIWKELSKVRGGAQTLTMFPFKIYNIPSWLYPSYIVDTSGSFWRTFNVHGGLVLNQYVSTGSYVWGTDRTEWPDWSTYPTPIGTGSAVVVPANTKQYWFWIEKLDTPLPVTGSYILRYGADPTTNGWTTFPTASSKFMPVGFVDTKTSASQYQAFVRQFLRTDILSSGAGGNYVTMSICLDGSAAIWYVDAYPSGSPPPSGSG